MYLLIGVRKSNPPKNRQLIVYYYLIEILSLRFCGRVDFLKLINNTFCEIKTPTKLNSECRTKLNSKCTPLCYRWRVPWQLPPSSWNLDVKGYLAQTEPPVRSRRECCVELLLS